MASVFMRVVVLLLISISVKLHADLSDEQIFQPRVESGHLGSSQSDSDLKNHEDDIVGISPPKDRSNRGRNESRNKSKVQPDSDLQRNDSGLPNLSDRPQTQDRNIDIFANALYWYTSETVDWGHILTGNVNSVQDSYKTISFNWDPGFRIGLGYNMDYDQWDTQIAYTWFQTQATDHGSGPITSGFLAARLSLLEPFQYGKISFNLQYNMFDWDLGRSFLVSKSLSLRPFIGAKGGWIHQKIHAKWTIPNFFGLDFLFFASENVKNNFQGGGPKGGFNGKWILGNVNRHVFSLVGNFAGAFMWGNWTLQDEFIDIFLTQTSIPMTSRNFGALMLQALMGFGWDFNFNENRSHVSLKAGYEIQDWFNHFQVFTNDSGTDNIDLILQGLTVDLRFDF